MSWPHPFMPESTAEFLRALRAAVLAGEGVAEFSAGQGIHPGTCTGRFRRLFDRFAMPRDVAEIDALLTLPMVSDAEARSRWNAAWQEAGARERWSPTKLSESDIEQRRNAVIAERRAREIALLEAERVRYGLPKRGRALSEMVV